MFCMLFQKDTNAFASLYRYRSWKAWPKLCKNVGMRAVLHVSLRCESRKVLSIWNAMIQLTYKWRNEHLHYLWKIEANDICKQDRVYFTVELEQVCTLLYIKDSGLYIWRVCRGLRGRMHSFRPVVLYRNWSQTLQALVLTLKCTCDGISHHFFIPL